MDDLTSASLLEVGHEMWLLNFLLIFQIEKIVLFLLEQQGLLASRLAKLDEQHDAIQQDRKSVV